MRSSFVLLCNPRGVQAFPSRLRPTSRRRRRGDTLQLMPTRRTIVGDGSGDGSGGSNAAHRGSEAPQMREVRGTER